MFVDISAHGKTKKTNGNLDYKWKPGLLIDNHKEVFVSVIHQKRAFKVHVDPLEWLSGFDKKLEERIFRGHGTCSPGQCVSWDVTSTRAIDDVKTEAGEFKSPM